MPKKQQKKERQLTIQEETLKLLSDLFKDFIDKPVQISISTREKVDRHIFSDVFLGISPLPVTGAKLPLKPRDNKMPKVVEFKLKEGSIAAVLDDIRAYVIINGVMVETDSVTMRITQE